MGNLCSTDAANGSSPAKAGQQQQQHPGRSQQQAVPDVEHHMRKGVSVRDVYKIGKTIGTGGFSVVKLATDKESGEQWACKIMSLPPPGKQYNENESSRADIFKEIDILISLKHDNVVFMKEYFEENNKVYLIMEMLPGGELLDAVLEKGHYSEADARAIFLQIMRAIQYLHSRGIVHRDLKLENLLLLEKKDINRVKIADFGLARRYMGAAAMTTICGTPQYVAPEIIKGGPARYGPECDLWSAGIILFILLGGYPPFYDESEPRLFEKIRKGKFDFNDEVWTMVSKDAKDMIQRLLVVEPAKRLTLDQVFEHPWCKMQAGNKQDLLKTMTRMRTSKAVLLPPQGHSADQVLEGAKSGPVLDLEETALADELLAEAADAKA